LLRPLLAGIAVGDGGDDGGLEVVLQLDGLVLGEIEGDGKVHHDAHEVRGHTGVGHNSIGNRGAGHSDSFW
jgi:hypothetical protein